MVLDVLEMIKDGQDASVTYRRSCREGVCGSDGLSINGKNGLACITALSDTVKGNKLVVRPLPGLPVIRDLVVDMSLFYAQYEKIQPYLQNNTPAPAIERLQNPRRSGEIRRLVRMHSLCLLLDQLPPHFGGIRIDLSDLQDCFKRIVSWLTAAIRPTDERLAGLDDPFKRFSLPRYSETASTSALKA